MATDKEGEAVHVVVDIAQGAIDYSISLAITELANNIELDE